MRRWIWLIAAGVVLAALGAATYLLTARRDMHPTGRFELAILNQGWQGLGLGYAAEPAQTILAGIGADATLVSFGEADIETYDWDTQILTLNAAATDRLLSAVAGLKPSADGAAELNALKESLGMGNALERQLYTQAFVVRLDGAPLYGGIFLDAPSQMAIDFPVARAGAAGGKTRIALLPVHIPFVQADPVGESGALETPVIVDEARHDVDELNKKDGFFDTWMRSVATTHGADAFRARIRDPRVRALFADR